VSVRTGESEFGEFDDRGVVGRGRWADLGTGPPPRVTAATPKASSDPLARMPHALLRIPSMMGGGLDGRQGSNREFEGELFAKKALPALAVGTPKAQEVLGRTHLRSQKSLLELGSIEVDAAVGLQKASPKHWGRTLRPPPLTPPPKPQPPPQRPPRSPLLAGASATLLASVEVRTPLAAASRSPGPATWAGGHGGGGNDGPAKMAEMDRRAVARLQRAPSMAPRVEDVGFESPRLGAGTSRVEAASEAAEAAAEARTVAASKPVAAVPGLATGGAGGSSSGSSSSSGFGVNSGFEVNMNVGVQGGGGVHADRSGEVQRPRPPPTLPPMALRGPPTQRSPPTHAQAGAGASKTVDRTGATNEPASSAASLAAPIAAQPARNVASRAVYQRPPLLPPKGMFPLQGGTPVFPPQGGTLMARPGNLLIDGTVGPPSSVSQPIGVTPTLGGELTLSVYWNWLAPRPLA
jgi:hypothetical protein